MADNSCKHVSALKKAHKEDKNIFEAVYSFWSNSMKNLFKAARLLSLKIWFSLFLMQN